MRIRNRWLTTVLAFGLVAVACGGTAATTTTAPPATTAADTTTTTQAAETTAPVAEFLTDVGVTETEIRLGVLADLSGPFAALVTDIVDAQRAYWKRVNDAGGIAERQVIIDPYIRDTSYNPQTHAEMFAEVLPEVVALAQSTGSPHTRAILPDLVSNDMFAMPLTWYSGWSDPQFGANVVEINSNYCLESMNLVEFARDTTQDEEGRDPTVAIVAFEGEYGQDGAEGVRLGADFYDLEVVFDGAGPPTADFPVAEIIAGVLQAQPDWIFFTLNDTFTAIILGQLVANGWDGYATGNLPSWSSNQLGGDNREALDQHYFASGYYQTWGGDSPGMEAMIAALAEDYPDRVPTDGFQVGWMEALVIERILRAAADSGDMTRAGVLAAATAITEFDLQGIAPNQPNVDDWNDNVVRETLVYKADLALYDSGGGSTGTIAGGGNAGLTLVKDAFTSEAAAQHDFTSACYTG